MKTLEMRLRAKLKQKKEITPEQQLKYDMNWILKKIKTGELDLNKKSQEIKLNIAISKGLVKKNEEGDYVIVRED